MGGLLGGLFGGISGGMGGLFSGLGSMFGSAFGSLGGLGGGESNSDLPMSVTPKQEPLPQMNTNGQGLLSGMFNPAIGQGREQNLVPTSGLTPLSNPNPAPNPMGALPQSTSMASPAQGGGLLSKIGNSMVSPAHADSAPTGADSNAFVNSMKTGQPMLASNGDPSTTNNPGSQGGMNFGELAKKYETSGKGPGFISTGMGGKDPGGVSYGSYQLESKQGTLQSYLKTGDDYTKQLSQYKVNSPEFQSKWKDLASSDPKGFEESQRNYLMNKPGGYNDAIGYASQLGWDTKNPAMQNAIFSISNQSGGWKSGIFNKAGISSGDDPKTQINKLYDARASYFNKLSLSPDVKSSIIQNRTIDERRDALNMIGV